MMMVSPIGRSNAAVTPVSILIPNPPIPVRRTTQIY
jgi:hypothetical protein